MTRLFVLLGIVCLAGVLFIVLATGGGAATPPKAKVLRLAIATEPKTLDPISITDANSDGVAHKIYNTLVRMERDPAAPESVRVVPDLAETFDISPDGKTYTFKLRHGVHFHNGREMHADDVVYSLSRLLTAESKRPEWLMPMVVGSAEYYYDKTKPLGITADDAYTVTLKLNKPFGPMIQQLCTINCAVVPREAVEDKARIFARSPVGVGAFKLTEWSNNQKLVLTRNDDYFKGKPKLDAIEFYIIKESSVRMERFFNGDLDAAADLPNGRVLEAMRRAGPQDSLKYNTLRTNYLGFGMPTGKFAGKPGLSPFGTNKLLRQAMSYAIDRDYLCETVLEGRGEPAHGVLPPGMPAFKPGRPGWPHDVAKAEELLAQAGYPHGQGLPVLPILVSNDENQKKIAEAVTEDFSKIGIQVDLQPRDWNFFVGTVEEQPRPAFLLGWIADYPDPDNFLYVLFNSNQAGSPGNNTFYSNPAVDELTEKARYLTDMQERIPLYQRAEDLILDDCSWLCTYHVVNEILLSHRVQGIRDHYTPLDTGSEFPQVDFAFVDIK